MEQVVGVSAITISSKSVAVLHLAVEHRLVELLQEAVLSAIHAHRICVRPVDLRLVLRMQGVEACLAPGVLLADTADDDVSIAAVAAYQETQPEPDAVSWDVLAGQSDIDEAKLSASAEENEDWESVCKWDQSQVVKWVANSGLACSSKASEAFQNVSSLNGSVLLKLPLDKFQPALEQHGCTTVESALIRQKIEVLSRLSQYAGGDHPEAQGHFTSAAVLRELMASSTLTHTAIGSSGGDGDVGGSGIGGSDKGQVWNDWALPRQAFKVWVRCCCDEVYGSDFTTQFESDNVFTAMQMSVEAKMHTILYGTALAARHAGRKWVCPKDLQIARRILHERC